MKKANHAILRSFPDRAAAEDFAQSLEDAGIQAEVIDNSPGFDITFTNATPVQEQYEVQIASSDLDEANDLLKRMARIRVKSAPDHHYLRNFEDEELVEVLVKEQEWNEYDVVVAELILRERGAMPASGDLEMRRIEQMVGQISPETTPFMTIVFGYLLALAGGIFGILIGVYLQLTRGTDSGGNKIPMFGRSVRIHGMVIVGLSILTFGFYVYSILSLIPD